MNDIPERISKQLETMVGLSILFEDEFYDTLTKTQRKQWNKLAKSIDKTCVVIQKHFKKKDLRK